MAFEFGPGGRERLEGIARQGGPVERKLADQALKAKERYEIEIVEQPKHEQELDRYLRKVPADLVLPPELRIYVANNSYCHGQTCVLVQVSPTKMVLTGRYQNGPIGTLEYTLHEGRWVTAPPRPDSQLHDNTDLATANVEIRTIERRQLFVDGKPVGENME
jgi:hypothetical protein